MRFVHVADLHLGNWKEEKLARLERKAFEKLIEAIENIAPDFVLISGDIFHNPLPRIDVLKTAIEGFMKLRKKNIPIAAIPGSHDFSPSGKTILSILDVSGIVKNVENISQDGVVRANEIKGMKIVGLGGRPGGTEIQLIKGLKFENGDILMLHTAVSGVMEKINGISLENLPRGFKYYALGHLHVQKIVSRNPWIAYPGFMFPTEFSEFKYPFCHFIVFDGTPKLEKIKIIDVEEITIKENLDGKEFESKIISEVIKRNLKNKIVLLRIEGTIRGKPINFRRVFEICNEKGAYHLLRNTRNLKREQYESIKVSEKSESELIKDIIEEAFRKNKYKEFEPIVLGMLEILGKEKQEGETNENYEERIIKDLDKLLHNLRL